LVWAMLERSPMRIPEAPGTAEVAEAAREELRAWSVTWWPWAMRVRAMACPIPSEEPVMKIRAICTVADSCGSGVVSKIV